MFRYPKPLLTILVIFAVVMGLQTRHFRLDASSDTLIHRNDPSFELTQKVAKKFGSDNTLIVSFRPNKHALLSKNAINQLSSLTEKLATLDGVSGVFSLLDVPIFKRNTSEDLLNTLRDSFTLRDSSPDLAAAKLEFEQNPLYQDLVISRDLSSTAIVLTISIPSDSGGLSRTEKDHIALQRKTLIDGIRATIEPYRANNTVFLGGISMITDDLIAFIANDLKWFGIGVLALLTLTLLAIFKRVLWVILPLICSALAIVTMTGIFGSFGWDVTVISSNFISIQLILTIALCLHLIIEFSELSHEHDLNAQDLALLTVKKKFVPCLFAGLTTIAGFASLIFSDIKSVSTFGWMMVVGVIVSYIITFLLFPILVSLFATPPFSLPAPSTRYSFPIWIGHWVKRHSTGCLVGCIGLSIWAVIGLGKLDVENRFIDYFRSSSEIYQGLSYIDKHLGGTVPVDIVVQLPETDTVATTEDDHDDFFDEFEQPDTDNPLYWFSPDRIDKTRDIQTYLDSLPETGKVLSFGSLIQLLEQLNGGPVDTFTFSLLYQQLPDWLKHTLITPFVDLGSSTLRFQVRVKDSLPDLKRGEFLDRLSSGLTQQLSIPANQVEISGALVLYNNVLRQLFDSQILTLGFVLVVLFIMFWLLFRSAVLAIVAIIPNLLSVGLILGLMGWFHIRLDLMTITLAAITMGIAVDDTIHYIYRFRESFQRLGTYHASLDDCHQSIGVVMFYTSIVVVIGFSILMISQFIPSVIFGFLTGLAMIVALVLSLSLLPSLIVRFRVFGGEFDA